MFVSDSILSYHGSKGLSHKLQVNYAISYFFYLYLMLYAWPARFNVTENLKIFAIFFGTKQDRDRINLAFMELKRYESLLILCV
jgi:hypothetical protein